MAQKLQFELNPAGVKQLLQSPEMKSALDGIASGITNRAGKGYNHNTMIGRNRATARVYTEDNAAYKDNLKNNTLLKAVK